MDNLQAAILKFRLKKIDQIIFKRRKNAEIYFNLLKQLPILLPLEKSGEFNTYHTFVIQTEKRDQLAEYLFEKGIETAIHYPVPIHLQPASKFLNHSIGSFKSTELQAKQILTLPVHQFLKSSDIKYICKEICEFFRE